MNNTHMFIHTFLNCLGIFQHHYTRGQAILMWHVQKQVLIYDTSVKFYLTQPGEYFSSRLCKKNLLSIKCYRREEILKRILDMENWMSQLTKSFSRFSTTDVATPCILQQHYNYVHFFQCYDHTTRSIIYEELKTNQASLLEAVRGIATSVVIQRHTPPFPCLRSKILVNKLSPV